MKCDASHGEARRRKRGGRATERHLAGKSLSELVFVLIFLLVPREEAAKVLGRHAHTPNYNEH